MKKAISLTLTLAMLLGVLTACGGGTTTESKAPAPENSTPPETKVTEVVFWSSMSGAMGETLQTIVDRYNDSQDAVHVTVEFQGNYYDMAAKLQTAVTSGETPHIAQLEMGRTKMFADYGILQDLTDLAKQYNFDLDQFYPGLMTCCDYGEGVFAVPFNRSTPMFYYNMDMFEEVGLDPNDPPADWTELREYAKKLSKPNERWGYEMPIDAWFYEAFIMQSNSKILNDDNTDIAFNNEAGTAPLYLWREMIAEGSMKAPPGQEYNSYEAARNDFAAGITGMIVTSSGDLGTLTNSCNFRIGTCFLPKNEVYAVPTGGANVTMMTGHDEDAAATIDFLKFLTSPEQAAYWSTKTGYVPSSPAAAETDTYKEFLKNENARTSLKQLSECTQIPRPVHEAFPEIHAEIMMTEIQRCVEQADYTPEMAVQAMSDQAKALLAH